MENTNQYTYFSMNGISGWVNSKTLEVVSGQDIIDSMLNNQKTELKSLTNLN